MVIKNSRKNLIFVKKKIANICNILCKLSLSKCRIFFTFEFVERKPVPLISTNLIKLTNRQQEYHVRSLHSKPNNEEVTFVGNTRHLTNGWLKYEVKEARAEKRRKNKATGSCERNSSRLTQLKPTLPQCERNIGS